MLSDEEKKAVEWFREDLAEEKENCGKYNDYKKQVIKRNEKILNLIEKQGKEIEELKEKNIKAGNLLAKRITMCNKAQCELEGLKEQNKQLDFLYNDACKCLLNTVSKDKIKAKIEELDMKDLTICYGVRSYGRTFQQSVITEVKNVLESFLEKE